MSSVTIKAECFQEARYGICSFNDLPDSSRQWDIVSEISRLRPWARTERAARFYERHPHAVLFVFGAAYAGFLLMMLQIVVRAVFG